MDALEDYPHLCLNFLTLPLPNRVQLVELLKQKLLALKVLNNLWLLFDGESKIQELSGVEVRATRRQLVKYLCRVVKLRESLRLILPAMQNYDYAVSNLLAKVNYECLLFANTVFPQLFVSLEAF